VQSRSRLRDDDAFHLRAIAVHGREPSHDRPPLRAPCPRRTRARGRAPRCLRERDRRVDAWWTPRCAQKIRSATGRDDRIGRGFALAWTFSWTSTLRNVASSANGRSRYAGALMKPSDGLEPLTPPYHPCGNRSQPTATVFTSVSRRAVVSFATGCHRLRPLCSNTCSIACCLKRDSVFGRPRKLRTLTLRPSGST
jgi:hypothetical protein